MERAQIYAHRWKKNKMGSIGIILIYINVHVRTTLGGKGGER